MKPEDQLSVWYGSALVGKLWRSATDKIGFNYQKQWLSIGFPISQQLPLRLDEYSPESGIAHQFFANLLPEANARMHVVRDLKISNSDFELLRAIGGDCAGALSILAEDEKPQEAFEYRKLTDADFGKMLLRKGYVFDFATSKEHPRLSLAGAQDKCPIFYDGQNYFLPEGSAASTHILKFEISGYRNIPAYEYFLTKLAGAVGLPVVDVQLCQHEKEFFLAVKRFDRLFNSRKGVQRLHQEDFCQALGIMHERKYQQAGGPSFQDCYRLIERVCVNPIKDLENLLRWQVFNAHAGNSDGHAKNLALLYNEHRQTQLAPFYDLVCTRAIDRVDIKLALSIGGEFNPDRISLKHWENLAISCNVRSSFLTNIIKDTAEALIENAPVIQREFEESFGPYPALQRVSKVVRKLCNKTLAALKSPHSTV